MMLVIRDLVKIYPGPVTALAGIDLDVPNGMFGLLGPNGAGKTTLMRILAGLLEPSSGTATLDGEAMLDQPEWIWGRLGYLPQDFGFFPRGTASNWAVQVGCALVPSREVLLLWSQGFKVSTCSSQGTAYGQPRTGFI
jgi:ABC-type multidrug transport system ATPase subunit